MSAREYVRFGCFRAIALKIKTSFTNKDHCPIYVLVHRARLQQHWMAQAITKIRGETSEDYSVSCFTDRLSFLIYSTGIVHRHVQKIVVTSLMCAVHQQAIIQNICHLIFTRYT